MKYKRELIAFANWVASEIMNDDFEEDADVFVEIACRKLFKLGIIKVEDGKWVYEYGIEEDDE